jgi:hypothetical protein
VRSRVVLVVALPVGVLLFTGWWQAQARANRRKTPTLPRNDPVVAALLRDVEAMRKGGKAPERVPEGARAYLEEIVLDRREPVDFRIGLLRAATRGRDGRLAARIADDPLEPEELRREARRILGGPR